MVLLEVSIEHVQNISTGVGQTFVYCIIVSIELSHVSLFQTQDPLLYSHKFNITNFRQEHTREKKTYNMDIFWMVQGLI